MSGLLADGSFVAHLNPPAIKIFVHFGDWTTEFAFEEGVIRFGKHPNNEVCTGGHSVRVSRYHAVLAWDGQTWHVRDLGSRYGTYINGQAVTYDAVAHVTSGDRLRVGDIDCDIAY